MHSDVKAIRGPFIDLEDRRDDPTLPSYVGLIDRTTGAETADVGNNSCFQAENATPIAMSSDLIDLVDLSDTKIIPVDMDLINFTMRTSIIRHADSGSSELSITSDNAFDLDPEAGTINAVHATKSSSGSGATTVGSLAPGPDECLSEFVAGLVTRLDSLLKLFEERLQWWGRFHAEVTFE
ncbi:hypothetical protein N7517_008328 [Penicillium concentricum]|uniref:Uncharacterized protein n=1 Tax=Penicillium concentricum TaxID=293559 RepID=A0A9W9V1K1_9EURO|nr:uncharacterized protein N7517_008328 [Penicillium concentricum]KAJ5365442.1 hypothetical protein N7517_008328 [Penicillium concentricum]